jgi:GABA permease
LHKVLIVANQTIGGAALETAVSERLAAGSCAFHLVVPVPPSPTAAIAVALASVESASAPIPEIPDQRQVAADRLTAGLAWLQSLGCSATGEVVSSDLVGEVRSIVERDQFDDIVVSTLPTRLSRWLRQDLPSRLGRQVTVPVVVVTAENEPEPD